MSGTDNSPVRFDQKDPQSWWTVGGAFVALGLVVYLLEPEAGVGIFAVVVGLVFVLVGIVIVAIRGNQSGG